jgi:hypothetical protein
MDVVETYELGDNTLEIVFDNTPESPRTFDNLSIMVCFHKRYALGDKHKYREDEFSGWDELRSTIEKDHDVVAIYPLYIYDHSGITISTTPFQCRWDSGQVGFVFVDKKTVRECMSVLRITQKMIDKVSADIEDEVNTYDQYLRGDVYGFQLTRKEVCRSCEHVEQEIIDSCYGFYGSDVQKNGILEHLSAEVREAVEKQL